MKKLSVRFTKKWQLWLILSLALTVATGLAIYILDTPINRLKLYILTDRNLISNAQIIEQTQETSGVDEHDTAHLKISPKQAQEIVKQNILQDCTKSLHNCTNPIWQPYENFHYYRSDDDTYINELGVPTILVSDEAEHVLCTSSWKLYDNRKENALGICVNTKSGDFWYELEIT